LSGTGVIFFGGDAWYVNSGPAGNVAWNTSQLGTGTWSPLPPGNSSGIIAEYYYYNCVTPTTTPTVTQTPTNTETPTPTPTPSPSEPLYPLTINIQSMSGGESVIFEGITYTANTTVNILINTPYLIDGVPSPGYILTGWGSIGGVSFEFLSGNTWTFSMNFTGGSSITPQYEEIPTPTPTITPSITPTTTITPTPSLTPNCVRQIVVPTLWNGATSINSNTLQLTQTSETLQIQVNDVITDNIGATSFVGIVSSDGTYTYVFTGPGGGVSFDCDFPLTFSGTC
jgi:hypothetical protein